MNRLDDTSGVNDDIYKITSWKKTSCKKKKVIKDERRKKFSVGGWQEKMRRGRTEELDGMDWRVEGGGFKGLGEYCSACLVIEIIICNHLPSTMIAKKKKSFFLVIQGENSRTPKKGVKKKIWERVKFPPLFLLRGVWYERQSFRKGNSHIIVDRKAAAW